MQIIALIFFLILIKIGMNRFRISCIGMTGNNIPSSSTVKESIFDVHLVSPISAYNFLGHVEVRYNNTWGTVCDNNFDFNAANNICNMLNYTRLICTSTNAQMGRGSGVFYIIISSILRL